MGRVRVQPRRPLRNRPDAAGPLAGGPGCAAPKPRQRGATARLHAHRAAHAAAQRRHGGDRCAPLRSAQPLSASDAMRCATRAGISPRCIWSMSDSGQMLCRLYPQDKTQQRQRDAPPARAAWRRAAPATTQPQPRTGIAPLLAQADAATGRHRFAAGRTCPKMNHRPDEGETR